MPVILLVLYILPVDLTLSLSLLLTLLQKLAVWKDSLFYPFLEDLGAWRFSFLSFLKLDAYGFPFLIFPQNYGPTDSTFYHFLPLYTSFSHHNRSPNYPCPSLPQSVCPSLSLQIFSSSHLHPCLIDRNLKHSPQSQSPTAPPIRSRTLQHCI